MLYHETINDTPSLNWEGFNFLKTLCGGSSKIFAGLYNGTTTELAKQSEVESLKSSVSDGKSLIASAITDKGVSTSSTATFQTMANNINLLTTTELPQEVLESITYSANISASDSGFRDSSRYIQYGSGSIKLRIYDADTNVLVNNISYSAYGNSWRPAEFRISGSPYNALEVHPTFTVNEITLKTKFTSCVLKCARSSGTKTLYTIYPSGGWITHDFNGSNVKCKNFVWGNMTATVDGYRYEIDASSIYVSPNWDLKIRILETSINLPYNTDAGT